SVTKEIQRINEREIASGNWSDSASWHAQYKDTAWVFIGNLDYDLTEGDIVCIFSQYGEIIHVELIKDRKTGKSKGFAFLQYEDQRSTILAVDNLNGANVINRTIRVDHSYGPKEKKRRDEEEEEEEEEGPKMNAAPSLIKGKQTDVRCNRCLLTDLLSILVKHKKEKKKEKEREYDDEDPMAEYFRNKKRKKSRH
ncbi:hypothetical protein BDB01DRAFT_724200, partial [Pilobolus umbonatus]